MIPKLVAYSINCARSFYKKTIPGDVKNIVFCIVMITLIISGKVNPDSAAKKTNLSFAVWNLDIIPARNHARIPLMDIFRVCESLLKRDITKDDSIIITGFSPEPFRVDKPENIRNGGVCLCLKENIPIKERRDLETLPETIVAEIKFFLFFLIVTQTC